jgi:hypothetical protein
LLEEADIVVQSGDGKQHVVSRAEFGRAVAQVQSALDDYFGSSDSYTTCDVVACAREQERMLSDKVMEGHQRWIGRQASHLIEACSGMVIESNDQPPRLQPRRLDLEYAISLLLEARPNKPGPGRPGSPRVNGPRLKELRRDAGMTQAGLVDSVNRHPGQAAALSLKSLRRYEHSEPGDPERLAVIAAILTDRLSRTVTVEDITF